MEKIKTEILDIIQDDSFTVQRLEKVLEPIGSFFTNQTFYNNILGLVDIITKDRNGDNQFNMDDLTLLGKDMGAIASLIGAIMLLLASIPGTKLQFNSEATEELVFKVLSYVFLVVVPKQVGTPLSLDDKKTVLNIVVSVYEIAKSSQIVNDLINKVTSWFKSKGMCKCTTSADQSDAVVTRRLPTFKRDLSHAVTNIREKSELKREINLLQQKLQEQSKPIEKDDRKEKSGKKDKSQKKF